jgi:hypothetical protein
MGMIVLGGLKAITLAVDAVILPVGLLHPVKEGLHLPDGEFFNFSGNFFEAPDGGWLAPSKEARDASYHPNCALSLTPLMQFPLQFLDGLVAISEATGMERFILPEHLQLLDRDLRNDRHFLALQVHSKGLPELIGIGKKLVPFAIFPIKSTHQKGHLVLVSRLTSARHTETHIMPFGRSGADGHMGMKIVRVVVQSIGVADRILGMKPLLKAVQNGLQGTPQNDVRIDPGPDQFVVKSRRHREDQPVLDHGMGR